MKHIGLKAKLLFVYLFCVLVVGCSHAPATEASFFKLVGAAVQNSLQASVPAPSPEVSITEQIKYVAKRKVNVRESASTESAVITTLSMGAEVVCLGVTGAWTEVSVSGKTGYIRSDLLQTGKPKETIEMKKVTDPAIVVYKARRTLEVYDGETLVASYPIGLGPQPVGHKQREGDGKTPEGEYYVCVRNSASNFYLSLGVSYPNEIDAKQGLSEGAIDQATYNSIASAIGSKRQPNWNTALGGAIMIHGMGGDRDWTAGCIAVDNDVMDVLWECCALGTPITIYP